jgi:dTDP-4-amino-4,6-dideoxygalactose transaminase
MPVHLGGNVADLDAVLAVARRRKLAVVEDTCQSHLAEWKGRKAGTHGDTGCFSFQASKNLNAGEGGAILTGSDAVADQCYAVHNHGRPRRAGAGPACRCQGVNFRMTEFQGGLLLAQMTRLEEQARRREQNARYLSGLLREVPGIRPAAMYAECTRNAYHLYMFRYSSEAFAGLPRAAFLGALSAEGVPASAGYTPLNKSPFIRQTLGSRGFQRLFSPERLALWEERNECPANDRLCAEACWMGQNVLLADRAEMERIAEAVRKIQKHAADLQNRLKKMG